MQDRFKFRAVLKTDRFVIIVPIDSICETGYQINTNVAQKIFENKYPNNCFFSDFLEIIEKQEYISQYSFDCDLLITEDFINLMQCTGVKDKNSKLIFEGDILRIHNKEVSCVEWMECYAQFHIEGYGVVESFFANTYEVIGNIYENPELLKGGQDEV